MKVTVKEKSETKEYPWIGISGDRTIILFHKYNAGICLSPPSLSNFDDWDQDNFKPFEGEIVLSNS